MYIYYRVLLYLFLGAMLFINSSGSAESPHLAVEVGPVSWQLRSFDGQPAPSWLRRPATRLLPELRSTVTGTCLQRLRRPQAGSCGLLVSNRLLASAHLITTLLCADDQAMQSELRYLHLLEQLNAYEIDGNSLRLYDNSHPVPRLVFVVGESQ